MDKIIDMSNRKGIQIIYPPKEVKKYSENYATLLLTADIIEPCAAIDPFGMCTTVECLSCANCNYQIIAKDGKILKEYYNGSDHGNEKKKYVIEFFDDFDGQDIKDYLNNEESDYRITRDEDRVILRLSKKDVQKRDESMNRSRQYIDDYFRSLTASCKEETPFLTEAYFPEEKKTLWKRIKETFQKG